MKSAIFFSNFHYIDPEKAQIHSDYSMSVVDGKVVAIGNKVEKPSEIAEFDVKNAFITPGLINIHCHLTGSGRKVPQFFLKHDHLAQFLANLSIIQKLLTKTMYKTAKDALSHGITTVRTLGDVSFDILEFRDKIRAGTLVGPRIYSAGKGISAKGGHGSIFNIAVSSVEEAAQVTNKMIEKGVDLIKLIATGGVTDAKTPDEAGKPQLSVEIMKEVCDIAHSHGLKVAAHCQSQKGVWNCIEAGVDSIEHGADYNTSLIEKMRANNVSIVPTLSAPHAYATHPISETGISLIALENSRRIQFLINEGVAAAKNTGILIGAGTDAGIPMVRHGDFAREISLFIELHGYTPMQALQCATINNARILGQENVLGSLAPGKWADFLIFEQNPLDEPASFLRPNRIFKGGSEFQA